MSSSNVKPLPVTAEARKRLLWVKWVRYSTEAITRFRNFFKPRVRFEVLTLEAWAVRNVPAEEQEDAILKLRFTAWLKYHKLDVSVYERRKMLKAFKAGARSIIDVNNSGGDE